MNNQIWAKKHNTVRFILSSPMHDSFSSQLTGDIYVNCLCNGEYVYYFKDYLLILDKIPDYINAGLKET